MEIFKSLISAVDTLIGGMDGGGGEPATPAARSYAAVRDLYGKHRAVEKPRGKLQSALQDLRAGKPPEYYRKVTRRVALDALTQEILKLSDEERTARETEWEWFFANSPPGSAGHASASEWDTRTKAFLAAFQSPLETLAERHDLKGPDFSTFINNLRNFPLAAHTSLHEAASAQIPAALAYSVAMKEGLAKYFLDQIPDHGFVLTESQLSQVKTTVLVNGFAVLGVDNFYTEYHNPNLPHPLKDYLPADFDIRDMDEVLGLSDQDLDSDELKPIQSTDAHNLKAGLRAMVAMLARYQTLFLEDAASLGFEPPSVREKVYWSYLYYSTGPGDRTQLVEGKRGFHQLYKYRPDHPDPAKRRALGDWITLGEYPNIFMALATYEAVVDAGLFPGY